jgi:glycosyltransferase involved in cell wall biosynthesis
MRIVHTESSCGWGGQEIRILSEAAGMLARGHDVEILCPPKSFIFDAAKRYGITAYSLPINRKSLSGVLAIRRWLIENKPDLINTHSSTDSWLSAIATRTLSQTIPIVRTRHISASVPKNRITRWLYCSATDHIVSTGESLREQLINENSFPAARITSVPTGVDSKCYLPAPDQQIVRRQLGLPEQGILIGIVATLRSWKGHDFLLDAFAMLRPGSATLLVVGDGPRRNTIEQGISLRGLDSSVILAGNQTEVANWLQALDIFVLPSYANEGVPQALIQAMLTGLPCVTTSIGSISEVAISDETAIIVPERNAQAIFSALIRLINNPELRQRLGSSGRAHCLKNFTMSNMLDNMERVFRDVISRYQSA